VNLCLRVLFVSEISSAEQPATQGFPMPLATTAACEVIPPRAVKIPKQHAFLQYLQARFLVLPEELSFPDSAQATASSAVKTIWPLAAPGLAGRPVAN
jgi:hypothetical protein